MTSTSSPMDFGSPPKTYQDGQPVKPVQLPPPHNPPDSFATVDVVVPTATPPLGVVAPAGQANPSRGDVASNITRLQSIMAASPVVKRMSEIENPTEQQVYAYECAIRATQEQAKNEMQLGEETYQERRKIESSALRAEEQQIKIAVQAEEQQMKTSARAEEQLVMERQEFQQAGLALRQFPI